VSSATRLLAVAAGPEQAARARADGADLIDARGATPAALASIRASLPSIVLWPGPAATGTAQAESFDADRLAAPPATGQPAAGQPPSGQPPSGQPPSGQPPPGPPLASVIAAAAIGTWLGVPVIHSRHTRAARRAIDMTLVIAGTQRPARALRGLA
jgi:hypothetical protein